MKSKLVATAACLVLLATGCSSTTTDISADDPGAVTPAPSPSASGPDGEGGFDDPTAGPDREPDEPREVPPLNLPTTAPGTAAAADALVAELDRFITDEQRAAGVPWPDYRNPDPIAVYRSDARFQNWMSANNPTPSLVEGYTAPGSPERSFDLEMFDFRHRNDLRSGPGNPPYSMRVEDLVHPAATGITDALLAQVPEGSAAVVYWDSAGPSEIFTSDGQLWGRNDGWVDVGPWVAIMAPTDVGWMVWWDELTEPPPPGSRQQKGLPTEQTPRRDV